MSEGRFETAVCLLRNMASSTTSPVSSSQRLSKWSSLIMLLSCFNSLTSPCLKLGISYPNQNFKQENNIKIRLKKKSEIQYHCMWILIGNKIPIRVLKFWGNEKWDVIKLESGSKGLDRKRGYGKRGEIKTWREGPGSQPGMAKRAEAGPREAASVVVATTRVTISPSFLLLVVTAEHVVAFLVVVQLAALCSSIRGAYQRPIANIYPVPKSRKGTTLRFHRHTFHL